MAVPPGSDVVGDAVAGDSVTPAGVVKVQIVEPADQASVMGEVVVVATADSSVKIASLAVTSPAGLLDTDEDPARFAATWNTELSPAGELTLTAVATDEAGVQGTASVTVTVVKPAAGHVSGFASVGAPVTEATVDVIAYPGLQEGELLGTAKTGAGGQFDVALTSAYSGTVLIRVSGSGAKYRSVATGQEHAFDADDALTLAIAVDLDVGAAGLHVNGLTTLIHALANAYAVQGAGTPLGEANTRLVEHILRPGGFVAATTPVVDLSEQHSDWPLPRTAVSLLHAGLSQMAAGWSESGTTTFMDVLQTLGRDLSADGRFDGKGVGGVTETVAGTYELDADTTRWSLAFNLDTFLEGPRNASKLRYDVLGLDDGFMTLVSTDVGPLYPPDAVPKRFDKTPPVITFVSPSPSAGALLAQSFIVAVTAKDDSPLTELVLVQPTQGVTPLASDLEAGTLEASIDPTKLASGPLDVVVRAVDLSGNEQQSVLSVELDPEPPLISIELPALFNDPSQKLMVTVTDQNPVVSVSAQLGASVTELELEGEVWTGTPPWAEGENNVEVTAVDAAGTPNKASKIVHLDTIAPTVTLLSPAPGSYVQPGDTELELSVTDASVVESVSVQLGGPATPAKPQGGLWVVSVNVGAVDAAVELTLMATDAAGNPAAEDTVGLNVDGTPPKITSVTVEGGVENGDVTYVAADTIKLEVEATDKGAGVTDVCVSGNCGAKTGAQTWLITLPDATDAPKTYTVVATDGADNPASTDVQIAKDVTPPTCTIDASPLNYWFDTTSVSLSGTVSDGGVGATSVELSANGLAAAAVLFDDDTFSGTITLPTGSSTVTVICTDALDNSSEPITLDANVDVEKPSVSLVTTKFASEQGLEVTWDGVSIKYEQFVPDTVTISETTCPVDGVCAKPWPKYASRLVHLEAAQLPSLNLPVLNLLPSDAGSSISPDEVSLVYIVSRGGTPLIAPRPVPVIEGAHQIPIAVQYVTDDDINSFAWTPDNVPTSVSVTATDLAGNDETFTWSFDLQILAPPLFIEALPSWSPAPFDASVFGLSKGALNEIGRQFGPTASPALKTVGGMRVARYVVENPYALDIAFVPPSTNSLHPYWEAQRVYLQLTQGLCLAGTGCTVPTSCAVGASCLAPPTDAETTFSPTKVPVNWVAYGSDQKDSVAPIPLELTAPLGTVTISAGDTIILDVMADTVDTCVLGPADDYDGPGASITVHVAGKTCGTYSPDSSKNDELTCAVKSTSLPPFFGCQIGDFAAPMALTSFRLGTEGPTSDSLSLLLKQYLPGFTDGVETANTAQHIVSFSYQTLATDLPLSP